MTILDDFSQWMKNNSNLSESSVYKYTRAVNTISNEMLEQRIINKRLLNMNIVELDIAINNIFNNMFFIEKNTRGDKMYSNALKQYRFFMQERSEDYSTEQSIENEILNSEILGTTEKQVIINARVGQGKYRESLIKKYDHKCIVTGIDKLNLLIASHIKPWRVCNNNERIDTENGLLLSANMDRLFDSGLISFTADGKMLISSFVGALNENRLHISKDIRVDLKATSKLLLYLEYHRDISFVK